jgi:hypothetical protein
MQVRAARLLRSGGRGRAGCGGLTAARRPSRSGKGPTRREGAPPRRPAAPRCSTGAWAWFRPLQLWPTVRYLLSWMATGRVAPSATLRQRVSHTPSTVFVSWLPRVYTDFAWGVGPHAWAPPAAWKAPWTKSRRCQIRLSMTTRTMRWAGRPATASNGGQLAWPIRCPRVTRVALPPLHWPTGRGVGKP